MARPSPPPDRSTPPSGFIDGVYNYCDRWCERCTLSSRCRVFQHERLFEEARQAGFSIEHAMDCAQADLDAMAGPLPPVSPEWERERDALIEAANREPSKEEVARWQAVEERRAAWAEAQPLCVAACDYMHQTLDLLPALQKRAATEPDPIGAAALQAIHHHALLICSKLRRAMSGSWGRFDPLADTEEREDDDNEIARYDANGSALVAHLAIVESRDAWEIISASSLFASNAMAPSMVRRLTDLDGSVLRKFPDALTFKRPGFDDVAAGE